MKKLLTFIIIMSLPFMINAEIFPKSGTAALQFLKLGVDARAIGMGGAYVSVGEDVSGTFWNPASISLSNKSQAFFSHNQYIADMMQEFVAMSFHPMFGSIAISASALHMPSMDVTTEEAFGPNGEKFNASNFSVGLSYSKRYTDKFSFGMTGKYVNENLEEESIHSYAFDLGTIYNTGFKDIKIAMVLKNYGPDVKYELDNDNDGSVDEEDLDDLDNDGDGLIDEDLEEYSFKIPMSYTLAASIKAFEMNNQNLILAVDVTAAVDTKESTRIGGEYNIGLFSLRAGYLFYEENEERFSTGVGFKLPSPFAIFNVDYSYTDMDKLQESFMATPHRLSLKMAF